MNETNGETFSPKLRLAVLKVSRGVIWLVHAQTGGAFFFMRCQLLLSYRLKIKNSLTGKFHGDIQFSLVISIWLISTNNC